MAKESRIEQEISFLQERYKIASNLLFALIVGETGLIYAVLSKEKPFYLLLFGIIGIIIAFILQQNIKNLKEEIYEQLEELEKC